MATIQAAAIREEKELAKLQKLVAKLAPDVPDRMTPFPMHSQDPLLLRGDQIAWINRFLGQIIRDQQAIEGDDDDDLFDDEAPAEVIPEEVEEAPEDGETTEDAIVSEEDSRASEGTTDAQDADSEAVEPEPVDPDVSEAVIETAEGADEVVLDIEPETPVEGTTGKRSKTR